MSDSCITRLWTEQIMESKRRLVIQYTIGSQEEVKCYRRIKAEQSETEWVGARGDMVFNKVTRLAH